jgi:hypothetical protein
MDVEQSCYSMDSTVGYDRLGWMGIVPQNCHFGMIFCEHPHLEGAGLLL